MYSQSRPFFKLVWVGWTQARSEERDAGERQKRKGRAERGVRTNSARTLWSVTRITYKIGASICIHRHDRFYMYVQSTHALVIIIPYIAL